MKKTVITSLAAVLVTTVAVAYDIHNANLKDAYASISDAIRHVEDARGGTVGKFRGHAAKTLDHLKQAQQEIIEGDKWNAAHPQ